MKNAKKVIQVKISNLEEEPMVSGRELLQFIMSRSIRASQRASTEENKASDEEAILRRARRRRYRYYDEEAESADELINPIQDEEYIDFRTYPLSIDWKEVENEDSAAYEVYESFGYFGVSCFTTLARTNQIKFNEKILKNILDFYIKNFEINTSESSKKIENFVKFLPSLEKIKNILFHRLLSSKELIPIKLVLDLYEHYFKHYEGPLYTRLINDYIPLASMFYASLSDEDLKSVYTRIVSEKEIYELLKNQLKFQISKKRSAYLNHFISLKKELMNSVSGTQAIQFMI